MEAFNLIITIYNTITHVMSSGSLLIVNHALQALFFSLAVSNLIASILKFIHFAYASTVA
jgi:hypothetical protein